jgi:hypothetical protein
MSCIAFLTLILVGILLAQTMIDISTERLITLSEAAKLLPQRRRGRKTHVSTLRRWVTCGSRGMRLESLRTPSGICTSVEAVQRFLEHVTHARRGEETPSHSRSLVQRQRASEAAARELKKLGL